MEALPGQIQQCAENQEEETDDVFGESLAAKSQLDDIPGRKAYDLTSVNSLPNGIIVDSSLQPK